MATMIISYSQVGFAKSWAPTGGLRIHSNDFGRIVNNSEFIKFAEQHPNRFKTPDDVRKLLKVPVVGNDPAGFAESVLLLKDDASFPVTFEPAAAKEFLKVVAEKDRKVAVDLAKKWGVVDLLPTEPWKMAADAKLHNRGPRQQDLDSMLSEVLQRTHQGDFQEYSVLNRFNNDEVKPPPGTPASCYFLLGPVSFKVNLDPTIDEMLSRDQIPALESLPKNLADATMQMAASGEKLSRPQIEKVLKAVERVAPEGRAAIALKMVLSNMKRPEASPHESVLSAFSEQGATPGPQGNLYIDPFMNYGALFNDERILKNAFFIANEMVPRTEKTFTWGKQEEFSGARQLMRLLSEELGNQVHRGELRVDDARSAVAKLQAELSKLRLPKSEAGYLMRIFEGSAKGTSVLPQTR